MTGVARNSVLFKVRLVLLVLLLARAGAAQESTELDELEPAVNTSEAVRADDAERDELQPAVPAAVLEADVTRQESGGEVMDRIDLGRTEITGNSELPTVLYIVPWRKSNPGELMGRPVNTLLDEVLAPLDREEFIRQVDYYDDLNGEVERK
jgi:hypothetical protein